MLPSSSFLNPTDASREHDVSLEEILSPLFVEGLPGQLKYFDTIRCRLPFSISNSIHAQRLLVLYFAVVGADLLGATWLTDAEGINASQSVCADIATELRRCYDPDSGGFRPEPSTLYINAPALAMTHCALHVLSTCRLLRGALRDWLDRDRVERFVRSCQVVSGGAAALFGESFHGAFAAAPAVAEVDLRFSYAALVSLALLHSPAPLPAVPSLRPLLDAAVGFVWRCWDAREGGFGAVPGAESHGGMTFCAVAALVLAGAADAMPRRARHAILRYAAARAVVGFQGRPQKDGDTCYAHWIGCAIRALHPEPLIDPRPIAQFVAACADARCGGAIAKHFGAKADPVHACLGLSGLLVVVGDTARGVALGGTRPPHPVYGCSWEATRAAGLPDLVPPPAQRDATSSATLAEVTPQGGEEEEEEEEFDCGRK